MSSSSTGSLSVADVRGATSIGGSSSYAISRADVAQTGALTTDAAPPRVGCGADHSWGVGAELGQWGSQPELAPLRRGFSLQ
jgi:hypothetical protein